MTKKETEPITVGRFYYLANEYRKYPLDESKLENTDITQEFFEELKNMIQDGELINITVNGKVRLGKSTLAITIGTIIWGYLNKKTAFSMKNIARDQQEYSEYMRDPTIMNTVIVTDEHNELEEGGENVTAEKQLQKVWSDVQAARYVHRISCSPQDVIDHNSDIIIEVIGTDKKKKITHAKIYYRILTGGGIGCLPQLLGYIRIPVGHIIKEWDTHIKKIWLNPEKTTQEHELIETIREKDFYVEYMIRKYEKMNLITKEGIMRPRLLEDAELILNVIEKIKPIVRMMGNINKDIIRSYIKMEARRLRKPTTWLYSELRTSDIASILELYKTHGKISQTIIKEERKGGDIAYIETLKETQKNVSWAIEENIKELERYNTIKKEYDVRGTLPCLQQQTSKPTPTTEKPGNQSLTAHNTHLAASKQKMETPSTPQQNKNTGKKY